ncbi:Uncharacterised protein [Mycobacteroides abscessus subsp. massiliense]|nr:Uncharacterised protein [Mycobacteroides abscessus subsp. massiliense]
MTLKPVAHTKTSISCSVPSAVMTEFSVMRSMGSVIKSTLGLVNVENHSLCMEGRLHPKAYVGVSFLRNSGSWGSCVHIQPLSASPTPCSTVL